MKKIVTMALGLSATIALAQEDGRVGINTDSPNATLNVKSKTGTSMATANLQLQNANDDLLVKVLDDGKVGIRTNPSATLHVNPKDGETPFLIKRDNTSLFQVDSEGSVVSDGKYIHFNHGAQKFNVSFGVSAYGSTPNEGYVDISSSHEKVVDALFSNRRLGHYLRLVASGAYLKAHPGKDSQILNINTYEANKTAPTLFTGLSIFNDTATTLVERGISLGINEAGDWQLGGKQYIDKATGKKVAEPYLAGNIKTRNIAVGFTKDPAERLDIDGGIKISTTEEYAKTSITSGATTPVPKGGAGTIIFQNGHFFGWTGSSWKQLDN